MAHNRPIPTDWADVAPGMSSTALQRHYKASWRTIAAWVKASGISRPPYVDSTRRPLPDDFEELCLSGMTRAELEATYQCSNSPITRWLGMVSAEAREAVNQAGYRSHRQKAVQQAIKSRKTGFVRDLSPTNIQRAPVGNVEQAMRYLQRFGACYPRSIHMKALEGYTFVLRPGVLSGDDIVAEAKRRGWNPDAWREVRAA